MFEHITGWRLPEIWRQFYEFSNGAYLVEGNVSLFPLMEGEYSLLKASETYRSAGMSVPQELMLAGDNGQGDNFGLWVTNPSQVEDSLVEIGQIFEPGCMAVVASSLERHLLMRSAYYFMLCEASMKAIEALNVPMELYSDDPDDDVLDALRAWADPNCLGSNSDPYDMRLDRQAITELLTGSQSPGEGNDP